MSNKTVSHSFSRGFSLVELVIVIIILGICLAPIGLLFNNAMAKFAIPETIQVATGLAEQKMEETTALRFSSIANVVSTPFTGQFASYSYQVIVSAVPPGLANDPGMTKYKQIEVRISHSLINPVSIITVATKK